MEKKKLSLWQRIQLLINGYVFLRWEKQGGDYQPVYLVRCKQHGLFEGQPRILDYPTGFELAFFCSKCIKNRRFKPIWLNSI